MTPATANRIVLISGGVLALITISAHRADANKETRYRALWAIGALTLGLSALADIIPEVAGPFALLVASAMVARNPGEVGRAIGFGGMTSSTPTAGQRPAGDRPITSTTYPR